MKIVQATGLIMSLTATGLLLQKSVIAAEKQDVVFSTNLLLEQKKSAFKKENITYIDIGDEKQPDGSQIKNLVRFFHASKFDGVKMTDVLVVDRFQNKIQRIIKAKSGKLSADKKSWDFSNGKVYVIDPITYKQFKHLKVALAKTPLEIATLDQHQEVPQSKQENFTYSDTIEKYQTDGSKVKYLSRFFYAHKFDGQQMTDPMIVDFTQNGVDRLIEASSGRLDIGEKTWNFFDGTVYEIDPKSKNSTKSQFKHLQMQLPGNRG